MVARQIIVAGAQPARDQNGRALPSKLRFYMPQTTTPAVVYADSDLTVPLAWPILSDDAGRYPQIWADEETYFDVVWTDRATDSNIAAYSNIRPPLAARRPRAAARWRDGRPLSDSVP